MRKIEDEKIKEDRTMLMKRREAAGKLDNLITSQLHITQRCVIM